MLQSAERLSLVYHRSSRAQALQVLCTICDQARWRNAYVTNRHDCRFLKHKTSIVCNKEFKCDGYVTTTKSWYVTITSMAEADIFNRFEPKQGYYSEKNKVHYVRHHIKGEWVRHHNENRLGVHKAEANFKIKKK